MSLFVFSHIGGALGRNIETLLVFRLLSGTFGSSPLANSGGVVSDLWLPKDRGLAAALYSTAPFQGPVFGPIVGNLACLQLS